MIDPLPLIKTLIQIPSVTGSEEKISKFLGRFLSKHGFKVNYIYSGSKRPNLFAANGKPRVLFCSHLDTVPPYIAPREDSKYLYGRGACDAKGVIAAQIAAGLRLMSSRVQQMSSRAQQMSSRAQQMSSRAQQMSSRAQRGIPIGFLYLIGEEVDHRGAIDVSKNIPKVEAIIVGEPTENRLAVATKGIVKVKLTSKGKAAHSAYPAHGKSAIEPLIRTLSRVQKLDLPALNIGVIRGGTAANIIPDEASAEILVRTVTKSRAIFNRLKRCCEKGVRIELQSINDPMKLSSEPFLRNESSLRKQGSPSFKTSVVSFNTDIPYLKYKAKKIFLLGPGSILDAHRPDEKISKKEVLKAVSLYSQLVKAILSCRA